MTLRLKLGTCALIALFLYALTIGAGWAGNSAELDAIARKGLNSLQLMASEFCRQTEAGKGYPSFHKCMEDQEKGLVTLLRANKAGYSRVAGPCTDGARLIDKASSKKEYLDMAAAARCVTAKTGKKF